MCGWLIWATTTNTKKGAPEGLLRAALPALLLCDQKPAKLIFCGMFDTIKALFAGFTGRLEPFPEARRLVWLLLVTFGFGWLAAAFAAWVSYPAYRALIEYLPGAARIAAAFTGGVAAFLYFSLAYLAGYLVERWRGVAPAARDYTVLGARILAAAAFLFLAADVAMNLQGADVRAADVVADAEPPKLQGSADAEALRARIASIEAGNVGGYGWKDDAGRWHLNKSGKAAIRAAAASIRRAEYADSLRAATALQLWQGEQGKAESIRTRARKTLRGAVYAVYVVMFVLCIVQAYAVETMQAAAGTSGRAGFASIPGRELADVPGVAPVVGYAPGAGGQRICKNCGKGFEPRTSWQTYCAEPCRVEAWEGKTGKTLTRGKNGYTAKS